MPKAGGWQKGRDSRSPTARTDTKSVRVAEVRVSEAASKGRSTTASRASTQPDHLVTRRTGPPGGKPEGSPTRIKPKEKLEVRRSLEMENDAAVTLADRGFRIKQNPTRPEVAEARAATGDIGGPDAKPDYLIEGRVFDCYSPTKPTKDVRGMWTEIETKVDDGQTQRVVINLRDWRGEMATLQNQFDSWPITGLKEVKAITPAGDVIQVIPNKRTTEEPQNGA